MMIHSLRTSAYRNLLDSVVNTAAKNIFLVGENGQGKTNFIEALYFCSFASSFRGSHDYELTRNNEKKFSASIEVSGEFSSVNINNEVSVKYENGKKIILINGKRAEDRRELLSITPSIVFCHEDMEFVGGSQERRRWFFDQTLSLYDPVYLEDLRRYRRVLKSRNTILREYVQNKLSGSPEQVLDALDPQLAMYGQKLMEKRETAVKQFSGIFGTLYEKVSGIAGINVQYIQSWKSGKNAASHLLERRAADLVSGISLAGPHRDRYIFAHNETDFTGKASTGQRRLLALLLRTAQACRYSEMTGFNPVLLLDDVLLEMDGEKRRRFLSVLPACDQAFFTFLPEEPYQRYKKEDTLIYTVKDGQVI
jgi:DNA replication and repair protein RecF